ncbi:MAG: SAM-dependent chlorinase/fluorinase [Lentimicrobiaceae bacterium]|nr:SAM-dependent chlorinase/fluorinase [Lentimicrobiaceae bacterium]
MASIITLTTDWGPRDHYAGIVKGMLHSRLTDVSIVDITHQVEPFNVKQASFILRNVFPYFPKGTVHIVGINTEESEQTPHIAIEYKGQFFIGADNGIFTLLFDEKPDAVVELTIPQESGFYIFSTRDRFVKAAVHLCNGGEIGQLGHTRDKLTTLISLQTQKNGNRLIGRVLYIDHYENVLLNITKHEFEEFGRKRRFNLNIRGKQHAVKQLYEAYSDVIPGEIVLLFSITGHLEIGINKGNASSLLGLSIDDMVVLEFD